MTLTDEYFAMTAARGVRASDLLQAVAPSVADTAYFGRSLSRPVFLERSAFHQLTTDLAALQSALLQLPDRVFGGDLAAFARAVGLAEPQVRAVVRGRGSAPSRLARADLYRDETGFRLLEMNMGSAIGGLDNSVLNRAMLEHPGINEFVTGHGLSYVDTLTELAETIRLESGVPSSRRPFVAIADWPESYPVLEAQLLTGARLLAAHGLDCEPCPVDRLVYRDNRIWLDDRAVDVVYRLFMVEDLLKPGAAELLEPVLYAAERNQVAIFTPMDAELFGTKGALALLSDDDHRAHFSPAQLAALDRILPWTRIVRPGLVSVDGRRVDLMSHAIANRTELVLKPTAEHAGQGVVLGWRTDPDSWRQRLEAAMVTPYVLQRRVHPIPERFCTDDSSEPWWLTWGAFLGARGFGGLWVRGTTDPDGGIVNMTTGATATCCFHQP